MTFNIHHGRGTDKRKDLSRIADVIHESGADLVGLNEVDRHFSRRSYFENQSEWLGKALNMDVAFSPSVSKKGKTENREFGNALLSRFPLTGVKSHFFHLSGMTERRSLLEANIDADGLLLRAAVTHLSLNPLLHRRQTDFVIQHFGKSAEPVVLMGDWNMKPGSKSWSRLTKYFQDGWQAAGAGPGYTYSSRRPRLRLDYIFTSQALEVNSIDVFDRIPAASDHVPVVATLRYKR